MCEKCKRLPKNLTIDLKEGYSEAIESLNQEIKEILTEVFDDEWKKKTCQEE